MQTGAIYLTPAALGPVTDQSPRPSSSTQYNATFDAAGLPFNGSLTFPNFQAAQAQGQEYPFLLNEIRAAVQNISSPPARDAAFACNPPVHALDDMLQWLQTVQGITSAEAEAHLGVLLDVGPLPAGALVP